jgi:hypothetical protein
LIMAVGRTGNVSPFRVRGTGVLLGQAQPDMGRLT